jgi:hypothetical protein
MGGAVPSRTCSAVTPHPTRKCSVSPVIRKSGKLVCGSTAPLIRGSAPLNPKYLALWCISLITIGFYGPCDFIHRVGARILEPASRWRGSRLTPARHMTPARRAGSQCSFSGCQCAGVGCSRWIRILLVASIKNCGGEYWRRGYNARPFLMLSDGLGPLADLAPNRLCREATARLGR